MAAQLERYELEEYLIESPAQAKVYLGRGEPLLCRYCGQSTHESTFKDISHAVPMFLGNKTILDLLECDRCNHHFSSYLEDSFANYTLPYRPFQRTRGRGGVPVYKDGNLRVSALGQDNLEFHLFGEHKINDIKFSDRKRMKFPLVRRPYYPVAIHKMLTKIALALLPPREHEKFPHLKAWLLRQDHQPLASGGPPVTEWLVSGPMPPDRIYCAIARARPAFQEKMFRYQLIFQFGNFQYQMIIPLLEENGCSKGIVEPPLLLPDEYIRRNGISDFRLHSFDSSERVKGEQVEVTIGYESEVTYLDLKQLHFGGNIS